MGGVMRGRDDGVGADDGADGPMRADENVVSVTGDLMRLLSQCVQVSQRRYVLLGQVADGDVVLTVTDREQLALMSRKVSAMATLVNAATGGVTKRVVGGAGDVGREYAPQRFLDAYRALFESVYGTGSSSSTGGRGYGDAGGRESGGKTGGTLDSRAWRTGTGREAGSGTGSGLTTATGGAGKFGAGKNVIRNEALYQKKRTMDQRLRRMAIDIENLLAEAASRDKAVRLVRWRCGQCRKLGEVTWKFCPGCGGVMGGE